MHRQHNAVALLSRVSAAILSLSLSQHRSSMFSPLTSCYPQFAQTTVPTPSHDCVPLMHNLEIGMHIGDCVTQSPIANLCGMYSLIITH